LKIKRPVESGVKSGGARNARRCSNMERDWREPTGMPSLNGCEGAITTSQGSHYITFAGASTKEY